MTQATAVTFTIRGEIIRYDRSEGKLRAGAREAPLRLSGPSLRLRLLVDRASIEVFADWGQVAITHSCLPKPENQALALEVEGGAARVRRIRVNSLRSAWRTEAGTTP
ncbi:MAG: hypothetical protein HN742_12700 [Lentisphaerae bacterium]|jgi:sucrose-6-phosphate hydrolase SacC (GH32 family)|nr:hypothetical protein [Lentisphaerota bacterium]MBT4814152.1 hypothetical protein [Lentisphaerota bacterium]MBT5607114.1 hypothetical protein [Lentisphaerota bacterium]MBT7053516.1 hypothetical protein [Lentisphaerota bacterium]MBT7842728.1 hypothetical protein [Lentisphaerota bacterium]